jgi:putative flippase GtrA
MNIPILIPAYNPDKTLISLVHQLIQLNFTDIIIVNDGSKVGCQEIFQQLKNFDCCHILEHAVNLGKGRALKTGLNYCYLHFHNTPGVITADADGQHLPNDILNIANTLEKHPDKLVLGVRTFQKNIPLRSLIGNVLTRYIFFILIGKQLSDTQTGLRGIPRSAIPGFMKIEGEDYDYEMNMLISTKSSGIQIIEEEVTTHYIDGNISSHFNPLIDSMKIYFVLLRFFSSSIITSLVDFVVFIISYNLIHYLSFSILIARIIASIINFTFNRSIVFRSKENFSGLILKYYSLLIIMGLLSYGLIKTMVDFFGFNVILSKVIVETFLFIANFAIQRDLIFINKSSNVTGNRNQ